MKKRLSQRGLLPTAPTVRTNKYRWASFKRGCISFLTGLFFFNMVKNDWKAWLRRIGVAGFLFFLIKGLVWLAVFMGLLKTACNA